MPLWVKKMEDEMKDFFSNVENTPIKQVYSNAEDAHITVESVDAERNYIEIGSNAE